MLKDVLYVPEIACNLISIGKLVSDSNCSLTFCSTSRVLQDQTLKRVIRVGEL